jgi:uncharacterized protein YebE (UPF0316 family)
MVFNLQNLMGMEFSWFDYVVLPLLIMLARIMDVSLDTIRVIMVAKGYRNLAPFVGFFQSLIWLITITRIMANLDNWFTYIGYSAGFGLGTYFGMRLEGKLALGYELVRVITRADASELINALREKGYPVTAVTGMGREGKVGILFIILKRRVIREVVKVIQKHNPNAFYTIEDMRFVSNHALLPAKRRLPRLSFRHR